MRVYSDGKGKVETAFGSAFPKISGLVFSPNRELLVTASVDRSIKMWDAASGTLRHSSSQHTDIAHGLAFRPRATGGANVPCFCVSASRDKTVRVWQPSIGRVVRIVCGHGGPVFAVVYSADGARLYSAGQEGIVRVNLRSRLLINASRRARI